MNELYDTLQALRTVFFGDLLSARGAGYLALLIGLAYCLAVWRARRMYERAVAADVPPGLQSLNAKLAESVNFVFSAPRTSEHELLRNEIGCKIRTVQLWLAFGLGMFAVQAYVLSLTAGDWTYMEQIYGTQIVMSQDIVPRSSYNDLWIMLACLSGVVVIIWINTFIDKDSGTSFKLEVMDWLAGLVDPIEPGAPANRAQRVLARVGLSAYLARKMNV